MMLCLPLRAVRMVFSEVCQRESMCDQITYLEDIVPLFLGDRVLCFPLLCIAYDRQSICSVDLLCSI
jgi:hypothetical protein